jgi:two-component system cell cycle response regulator
MGNGNSKTTLDASEILLIGSPSTILAEAQSAGRHFDYAGNALPIQTCPGITEAIEAAGKNRFAVITVVMGSAVNIRSGLVALRKNTSARILLLARMYEEPTARELVNGSGLADDYVICPIRLEKLCEAINPRQEAVLETTETRDRIRRLEKLATEDDLTGLKNRRYILEFARQIIERAKKDSGRVTVLIFDIDNFKHYNDEYGHAAGDEVLKQAAVLIRRCCRTHDAVARLGGDEFAVVFWDDPRCPPPAAGEERRTPSAEHPREVILIAKRFRKELGKADLRLLGAEGKGVLTISGGLSRLGVDGSTPEELFAKADEALLDAKRSGKNRVYLVGKSENDIDKIE